MTSPRPRTTATETRRRACRAIADVLLGAVLLLSGTLAWAGTVVGTVLNLSGPLLDRKADGTVKVLARQSTVENGDTLVAEKATYAQIRFIDNSEITLKPGTTFRIENFAYDAAAPDGDSASFNLVKGGLRSITGLLGKRNKDKFSLKTPAATIGIRGTTFIAEWSQAPAAPSSAPSPAPGLYVQVLDGAIFVANGGGALDFQAGQFGYVPSPVQPPVLVPQNPGLQFAPPPAFGAGTADAAAGGQVKVPSTVDCVVR